jgi:hypothetical protein
MLQNDGQTSNHHHHLHSHHQTLSLFFFLLFVRTLVFQWAQSRYSQWSHCRWHEKSASIIFDDAHFLSHFLVCGLSLSLSREASHLFPILLFAYNQPSMLAKISEIAFVYLVNSGIPFSSPSLSLPFPSTNNLTFYVNVDIIQLTPFFLNKYY